MLRYLRDPANMITGAGHALCAVSLFFALSGRPELGTAVILWAWLADQFDGIVARRMKDRRSAETAAIGKSFDGFADLIHGVIFPAVVLIILTPGSVLSLVTSLALVLFGALRLSYFDNFGLANGIYRGVPVSYNVPLLVVLFLLRPYLAPDVFPAIVNIAFLILAFLHISPLRVPAFGGAMYPVLTVFGCITSTILAVRTFH